MSASIPFTSVPFNEEAGALVSRTSRTVDDHPWTGPLHFDLLNARGWAAGTAELAVDLETLSFRFGDRTLAVIVRHDFQAWLLDPVDPLASDDVVWSSESGAVCLTVEQRSFYSVPGDTVDVLRTLL